MDGVSDALMLKCDEIIRTVIDKICHYYTDTGYTVRFDYDRILGDFDLYPEERADFDPRDHDIKIEKYEKKYTMTDLGQLTISWNDESGDTVLIDARPDNRGLRIRRK